MSVTSLGQCTQLGLHLIDVRPLTRARLGAAAAWRNQSSAWVLTKEGPALRRPLFICSELPVVYFRAAGVAGQVVPEISRIEVASNSGRLI
jgi:hypothetical protein